MTKGEEVMEKIKEQEKKEEEERNKYKELKSKYADFAIKKICPDCGKELIKNVEVIYFINGEYGPLHLYINCDCGFYFSTMSDEEVRTAIEYFNNVSKKVEKSNKRSFFEWIFGT